MVAIMQKIPKGFVERLSRVGGFFCTTKMRLLIQPRGGVVLCCGSVVRVVFEGFEGGW